MCQCVGAGATGFGPVQNSVQLTTRSENHVEAAAGSSRLSGKLARIEK
jgi:hypothetical protein